MAKSELRVFLASPGGLDAERDAAERVALQLTAQFSDRFGVTITVRRFEQLTARPGRPQDLINPWIDDCDVFIAIVHRRWGSPSGLDTHTGFSEEFERAIERYARTSAPVVSLYFKAVDPASEADPGSELKQVLAFRRRIEAEHVGLYKKFETLETFEKDVQSLLLEEMLRLADGIADPTDADRGSSTGSGSSESEAGDIPHQASIELVMQDYLDALRERPPTKPLDPDRLVLFAQAVARDVTVPDVHLCNRVFLRAPEEVLSRWEMDALFVAYVRDHGRADGRSSRVVPAALKFGVDEICERLTNSDPVLLDTEQPDIPRGFLRLASAFAIRPESLWGGDEPTAEWERLIRHGLSNEIVEHWAVVANADDAETARSVGGSAHEHTALTGAALLSLIDDSEPIDALIDLDPKLIMGRHVRSRLGEWPLTRASTEKVSELADMKYGGDDRRILAYEEIARRDAWPSEAVGTLLKRSEHHRSSIDRWERRARELLFASTSEDTVDKMIAEARRADGRAHALLSVAASGNETLRAQTRSIEGEAITEHYADEVLAWTTDEEAAYVVALEAVEGTYAPVTRLLNSASAAQKQEVGQYLLDRNAVAGLRYLVSKEEHRVEGLRRTRRLLQERPRLRSDLLTILAEHATDEDVPVVLADASFRYSMDAEDLARLLSRATLRRLRSLLNDRPAPVVVAALVELVRRDRRPSSTILRGLLRHAEATVRMAALDALGPNVSDPADFIATYAREQRMYYYNVVCELDRLAAGVAATY